MVDSNNKVAPDFIIAGPPKCGTTGLCSTLSQHKEIYISNPKEPGYFSRDITKKSCRYSNLEEYNKNCFRNYEGNYIFGESSTTTIYSEIALEQLQSLNNNIKVIVFIRNPTQLVYSHYQQQLKIGYESCKRFVDAWKLIDKRRKGKSIPLSCEIPFNLRYDEIGMISDRILKFKQVLNENLLILDYENYKKNHDETILIILKFLGVENCKLQKRITNRSSVPKSARISQLTRLIAKIRVFVGLKSGLGIGSLIRNLNSKNSGKIDTKSRNLLDNFYKEELARQKILLSEINND